MKTTENGIQESDCLLSQWLWSKAAQCRLLAEFLGICRSSTHDKCGWLPCKINNTIDYRVDDKVLVPFLLVFIIAKKRRAIMWKRTLRPGSSHLQHVWLCRCSGMNQSSGAIIPGQSCSLNIRRKERKGKELETLLWNSTGGWHIAVHSKERSSGTLIRTKNVHKLKKRVTELDTLKKRVT